MTALKHTPRISGSVEPAAQPESGPIVIEMANQPPTMLAYLKAAESGADLDRLKMLMDLHERYEEGRARREFGIAMAKFRAEEMVIFKTKFVNIPNGPKFWHAQLADVCAAVISKMSKYGLRHRWKTLQDHEGCKTVQITVTCIITHELGHGEETTLSGPPDTQGNKSPIHAISSTVALLERYTLLAGVGLAAREMDNNPTGTGIKDPPSAGKAPAMPDGLENWMADARAIADEGNVRLQAHWKDTTKEVRRYVSTHESAFWADCKARALKVDQKAKVSP